MLESCKAIPLWSKSINQEGHQNKVARTPHTSVSIVFVDVSMAQTVYKPSANSVGRVFSMPTVEELYLISSFELDHAVDSIGTTNRAANLFSALYPTHMKF
jgi:hypothetical protein